MPDLLLELFSEEIPARMQRQATADLERLVTGALLDNGLSYEGAVGFATPRRLALHVAGIPARQADRREERRGPRVGAPDGAVQGFLKSAGLASLDDARIEADPKGKGAFYVAVQEKRGRAAIEVLGELLPRLIREFPWPKSMRWGAASIRADSLRWARPLHSVLATFGPETEDPEVVPFAIDGVASGNLTYGHRFMAPGAIRVRRLDDYAQSLAKAKVVLDLARRKNIILHDARDLALAQGLELIEDDGLAEETAGLVEWPVVLLGSFSEDFLAVPHEAVRATIRANQKCFVLKRPDGALANKFLLVANIEASDGGRAVVAGNERVVKARLSDAKFFWDMDRKSPLEARLPKLDAIIFHEKLGAQGERRRRLQSLARALAPKLGADPDKAERAAQLAKADLVTEMVGEFPELQGVMGRYYASAQGEDADVAAAIEEHYKPQGPSDRVPTQPVAMAVALADKIDALVGFWSIDEKPTGSKDPYALRRAALGIIRIVLENGVRLRIGADAIDHDARAGLLAANDSTARSRRDDLLGFFIDRLKVYLRDKGARHDLIDAAIGASNQSRHRSAAAPDDLLLILRRVEALGRFLETEDGKSLLAGFRRAVNIVRIEEKKDGEGAFGARHRPELLLAQEEKRLAEAIALAGDRASMLVEMEDFEAAMRALAELRGPVDAFFDKVTVNDPDPELRANRLRLLSELRGAMLETADFSKIAAMAAA